MQRSQPEHKTDPSHIEIDGYSDECNSMIITPSPPYTEYSPALQIGIRALQSQGYALDVKLPELPEKIISRD